jgi:hypothetical protein
MPVLRLSTLRETRNPVRVQTWNASVRAGDDFKLALTVLGSDDGVPAVVAGSRSQLALWPDSRWGNSPDYGLGWYTGAVYGSGSPSVVIVGFTTPVRGGGINFALGASSTANLCGRYRLSIQVDLPDGEFSMVEGILQVREAWAGPGLGHVPANFFILDVSQLDVGILAPDVSVDGYPIDADGFFLLRDDFLTGPAVPAPETMDFDGDFA